MFQHSEDLKRYLSKFESSGTVLFITLLSESVVECLLLALDMTMLMESVHINMVGTRCV